jgi:L-seryl-tRNA(Ser) seleniumtransferase
MVCQALEQTLRSLLLERWEDVPALAMIRLTAASIRARAEALVARIRGIRAEIVPGSSLAGGGATPQQAIPTWLIAIECDAVAAEAALRAGDPPIIARIQDERLVLDLRTVFREEEQELAAALGALAGSGALG